MTGRVQKRPVPQWLVAVGFAVYGAAVLALTAGPQPPGRFAIAGNVVLFVPLGGLLAVGWPRLHPLTVTAMGFVVSCGIEVTQLLVLTHRNPSLNDIALNTAGTALGWVAGRFLLDTIGWWKRRRHRGPWQ